MITDAPERRGTEAIKPGTVIKILTQGDTVLAQVTHGLDRFMLKIEGREQTVMNRVNSVVAVAADRSLWMVQGKALVRHDGTDWQEFQHDRVDDGELYALDNGDIWLAGRGILIVKSVIP